MNKNLLIHKMEEDSEFLNFSKLNDKHFSRFYQLLLDERSQNLKHIVCTLEQKKYLECVLLPKFKTLNLTNTIKSNKELLFSIVLLVNHKINLKINIFEYFRKSGNEDLFSKIFDNLLEFSLVELNEEERKIFIQFLIHCYQNIEESYIAKTCLKYLSIVIWVNLSKESLKNLLMESDKHLDKWKKFLQLSKKQNFSNSKITTFFNQFFDDYLQIIESKNLNVNQYLTFSEKLVEFLTDLLSQISIRKFLLPLVKEKHFYERITLITKFYASQDSCNLKIFSKMLENLKIYFNFQLNEETGDNLPQNLLLEKYYSNLNYMQNVAFNLFPAKLSKIYLKNISQIDNTENLIEMLDNLDENELIQFAECLYLLNYKPNFYKNKRDLIYLIFLSKYERKETVVESLNNSPLFPDEKILFDREIIPEEYSDIEKSLPIPKLNLQFLSFNDYLLRNFNLFRYESIYEIRKDIEDCVQRMCPKFDSRRKFINFDGWARMGIPIKSFKILNVKPAQIGKKYSSEIIAEIEVDLKGVQVQIKNEWDKLKRYDVLFSLNFHKANNPENFDIKFIRGSEVLNIFDEENNEISDYENLNKKRPVGATRRIHVLLDPVQYSKDINDKNITPEEIYTDLQLLIRRKPEKNNFKAILSTMRDLLNTSSAVPSWLAKLFLGWGDPSQAHFSKFPLEKVDLADTFVDKQHYEECLTNNEYFPKKNNLVTGEISLQRKNPIRFTKKQVEAIYSGTQKGLTLIVGPPGTGKTDVAVQIVSLLYHNFPRQRTLIITHSNHALNDIFEKISQLDIDEKYLLRLGMGEKDLATEKDFSRSGRINYWLKRRSELLAFVLKIAHCLSIFTFEEYTCEHAVNMYNFNLKHKIEKLLKIKTLKTNPIPELINEFLPLLSLFGCQISQNLVENIQPLQEVLSQIQNIFKEVQELRAFELIRNNYERGNHLLLKGAKIIAMTCTHAALKRKDLVNLGFEYDNIIIEEAGQILEVETFIPLLLQESSNKESKLKRVVLIGDNSQLPPIIKNNAFKDYGKMDQSLYSRLLRLGVPSITLDLQGRSRPSIVDLYRWKYDNLKDLLEIQQNEQFILANTGIKKEFQFIDVPDFEGRGEFSPSPFVYQNLAEAEYIVALFMYMCLVGYEPSKITILTTYNGQKELIKDIFKQKCSWSPMFSSPSKITTVDKYQGQQNDFILLSLVRSNNMGHLRDIRRLIVAMSRARLGLYVFGRWNLFSNVLEFENTVKTFSKNSNNLELVMGENYPTNRDPREEICQSIKVEDFRHMYRIVQEILKIKFSKS